MGCSVNFPVVLSGIDIHLPKISMPSFSLKRDKGDKDEDKEEEDKEKAEEPESPEEDKDKKKKRRSKGMDFHVNLPKFPSFSRKKKGQ